MKVPSIVRRPAMAMAAAIAVLAMTFGTFGGGASPANASCGVGFCGCSNLATATFLNHFDAFGTHWHWWELVDGTQHYEPCGSA